MRLLPHADGTFHKPHGRPVRHVGVRGADIDELDRQPCHRPVARGVVERDRARCAHEARAPDPRDDVLGPVLGPGGDAQRRGPDGVVGEGVVRAARRGEGGRRHGDERAPHGLAVGGGEGGLEGRAALATERVEVEEEPAGEQRAQLLGPRG